MHSSRIKNSASSHSKSFGQRWDKVRSWHTPTVPKMEKKARKLALAHGADDLPLHFGLGRGRAGGGGGLWGLGGGPDRPLLAQDPGVCRVERTDANSPF